MKINIFSIILIGFLLRISVAVWSGFFGPSPGADLDAMGLNGFASAVATTGNFDEFIIGFNPYTNTLGLIYSLTINHMFVGNVISCLVWGFSALIFKKSCYLLFDDLRQIRAATWIYALLPTSIFLTSVTLREPYQLFFVNLAIYAMLRVYIQNEKKYWFMLVIAIAGGGLLHGALLAFGIILIACTLILSVLRGRKNISWGKFVLMTALAIIILSFGFAMFGNVSYNLDNGLAGAIDWYQQRALSVEARTNYKSEASITSFLDLLLFIPVSLFQYWFEPLPWHVSSVGDVLLVLENFLRAWLIWQVIKTWKKLKYKSVLYRRSFLVIALSYILLETIWSVGTVNWGTAARHHLPACGLLLLAAYASPIRKTSTKEASTYTASVALSAKV